MENQAPTPDIDNSTGLHTSGNTSVTEVINPAQVARLAATLGVYSACEHEAAILLPGWHAVFCNAILNAHDLATDGLPGADLRCESRIKTITPKTGRARPMLVLALEREFLLDKEVSVMENQSVIYKQDGAPPATDVKATEKERDIEA